MRAHDERRGPRSRRTPEDTAFGEAEVVNAYPEYRPTRYHGALMHGADDPAHRRADLHEVSDATDTKERAD
jgi:hypothetical protein